jgi:hypothetical protein
MKTGTKYICKMVFVGPAKCVAILESEIRGSLWPELGNVYWLVCYIKGPVTAKKEL